MSGDSISVRQQKEIEKLTSRLEKLEQERLVNKTLLEISSKVGLTIELTELFEVIHHALSRIVDTTNFYIAQYDIEEDSLLFSYIVDTVDDIYPKAFNVSATSSLTAEVVRRGKSLLIDYDEIIAMRENSKLKVSGCSPAQIWLGVPLMINDTIVGVMAVQSYKDRNVYGTNDVEIMESVAGQVAIAIERQKTKVALIENEERFRLSMEATRDGLWDWDVTTNEVYFSPSYWTMLGFEGTDELLDLSAWTNLLHPDDEEQAVSISQDCIDGKCDTFEIEYRIKTRSGGWNWVQGRGKAVARDKDGKATRMIGTQKDVESRKMQEEALERRVIALTRPLEDEVDIGFDELFNIEDIQRLQDEFADTIGISSGIFDIEGKRVTKPSRPNRFCAIIKSSELGRKQCNDSDQVLVRLSNDGPKIHHCLSAGLLDAGASIFVGGHHIANWLMGAVRDESTTDEDVITYARKIGVDENELLDAFYEIPVVSKEQFEKAGKVLFTIAQQLSVSAYQNIQQARFISELKGLEAQTRDDAERLKALFSAINDAILIHPYQEEGFGEFVEVNDIACSKYGYSRDEFLTLSPLDITHEDDAKRHASKQERQTLLKMRNIVFETTHRTKSGDPFPVEINANVVVISGKKLVLAVVRDITERKNAQAERYKLETQLNQAQKMESVGRLAGGVAHDFNNMLSVILGHTEMALEDVAFTNPLFNDLTQIQKAAQHSAELTKQLLAFARKQSIAPQILDVNLTIENLLSMLQRLLGEDIELSWIAGNEIWAIKIDPGQLDQVLTNLCVNARDAITGTGKIIIETSNVSVDGTFSATHPGFQGGDYVLLTVCDNGAGIEKDILPYIFEPFYTTKNVGEGTGLGLATVYGILKQNNGYISVYSEEAKGTTFKIYLPRELQYNDDVQNQTEELQLKPGKETILLVEDEPGILTMGTQMLQKHGYKVLSAESPIQALDIVKTYSEEIHLLLTDVIMPGMNGKDLRDKIHLTHPEIKCLYMSGYTANIIAEQGVLDEDVNFVQKPFSRAHFLAKVRDVLE